MSGTIANGCLSPILRGMSGVVDLCTINKCCERLFGTKENVMYVWLEFYGQKQCHFKIATEAIGSLSLLTWVCTKESNVTSKQVEVNVMVVSDILENIGILCGNLIVFILLQITQLTCSKHRRLQELLNVVINIDNWRTLSSNPRKFRKWMLERM